MGSRTSGWTGRNFPWCAWRIRTMRLSTGCPVQSRNGCGRSNSCEGPSMAIPALARDFKEFLKTLNSNRVEYLFTGGYAAGIHGHIRATNDLHIWINVSKENAEKIHRVLRDFGFAGADLTPDLFLVRTNMVRMGVPPIR